MVRGDGQGAYPICGDIPFLMAPEQLVADALRERVDITSSIYAEAYAETAYYTAESGQARDDLHNSSGAKNLQRIVTASESERAQFPDCRRVWLDATYELAAQRDAYRHVRPLRNARVLQLGGSGLHALKFLIAGAEEAWLASPIVGELELANALAAHVGVADRFHTVAAVAEELPFADFSFDAIYSQGSVHHWVISLAMSECLRVLKPHGRFAAVEPWRGPFYGIGTRLLGKRQRDVHCVVLTASRIIPHLHQFMNAAIVHHWTLSRYPLLALAKLGLHPSRETVWRIGALDDHVTSRFERLRGLGSSVAILASR